MDFPTLAGIVLLALVVTFLAACAVGRAWPSPEHGGKE